MEILVYYGDSYAENHGIQIQKVGRVKSTHYLLTKNRHCHLGWNYGASEFQYCPYAVFVLQEQFQIFLSTVFVFTRLRCVQCKLW